MDIDQALNNIDKSDADIIELMSGMIGIQAVSPASGGQGESKRADYIMSVLKGFDDVIRLDYDDEGHPGIKRSNVVAIKKGKKPETVWILTHIDTVPAGELSDWKYDPFKLTVEDGKLYGRGTEDDGEAVIASILAFNQFADRKFNGKSLGLMFLADEEVGSNYGLVKFVDSGIFHKGDEFFIPDSSDEYGASIHIMEKSIAWVMVDIYGKAAHGSAPRAGVNPIPVGIAMLNDILAMAEKNYPETDDGFEDERSTFTPTRLEVSPGGVNAIPAHMFFAIDGRMVPSADPEKYLDDAKRIVDEYRARYGNSPRIEANYLLDLGGKASSTDTALCKALSRGIEKIVGKPVRFCGPNGGTVASHLRKRGFDCYGWMMYTGNEHMPNEHTSIDNVKKTTKVIAMMIDELCL